MENPGNNDQCHACGGVLGAGRREVARKVGARRFTAMLPTRRCGACAEVTFEGPVLARFEAAVTEALVHAGAQDGEAIRWLRKSTDLRAVDLGELLGVTPETISRWENDRVAAPRAAVAVLAELALADEAGRRAIVARLRTLASPERAPRGAVTLDVSPI